MTRRQDTSDNRDGRLRRSRSQNSTRALITDKARNVSLRQVNATTRQTRRIQVVRQVAALHCARNTILPRTLNILEIRLTLPARERINGLHDTRWEHACERTQRHGNVLHHVMQPPGSNLHLVTAKPAHTISDESRVLNIRGTTPIDLTSVSSRSTQTPTRNTPQAPLAGFHAANAPTREPGTKSLSQRRTTNRRRKQPQGATISDSAPRKKNEGQPRLPLNTLLA